MHPRKWELGVGKSTLPSPTPKAHRGGGTSAPNHHSPHPHPSHEASRSGILWKGRDWDPEIRVNGQVLPSASCVTVAMPFTSSLCWRLQGEKQWTPWKQSLPRSPALPFAISWSKATSSFLELPNLTSCSPLTSRSSGNPAESDILPHIPPALVKATPISPGWQVLTAHHSWGGGRFSAEQPK